jgi:hypothetical protein
MEDDLKISKVEYISNYCMDCELWVLRGEIEENPEEISSVTLLSPACFTLLLYQTEIEYIIAGSIHRGKLFPSLKIMIYFIDIYLNFCTPNHDA